RAVAILALSIAAFGCSKSKSEGAGDAGTAAASAPAAAGSPLAFLNGFEGEIGILVKGASKHGGQDVPPLSLQIKGDKVRAEMPPGRGAGSAMANMKGYVILNTPEKKLYIVMDDQKQVIVFDLNKTAEQFKSFGAGGGSAGTSKPGGPQKPPPKLTK